MDRQTLIDTMIRTGAFVFDETLSCDPKVGKFAFNHSQNIADAFVEVVMNDARAIRNDGGSIAIHGMAESLSTIVPLVAEGLQKPGSQVAWSFAYGTGRMGFIPEESKVIVLDTVLCDSETAEARIRNTPFYPKVAMLAVILGDKEQEGGSAAYKFRERTNIVAKAIFDAAEVRERKDYLDGEMSRRIKAMLSETAHGRPPHISRRE
jgi:hypothetical protein